MLCSKTKLPCELAFTGYLDSWVTFDRRPLNMPHPCSEKDEKTEVQITKRLQNGIQKHSEAQELRQPFQKAAAKLKRGPSCCSSALHD